MTKTYTSPTEHMRKIEFIMGTPDSLNQLRQQAEKLGNEKQGSRKALEEIADILKTKYKWTNTKDIVVNKRVSRIKERVAESGAGNEVLVVNNTIENAKVTRKVTKLLNGRFIDVVQ